METSSAGNFVQTALARHYRIVDPTTTLRQIQEIKIYIILGPGFSYAKL